MVHHIFVLLASLASALLFLYGWYGQQLIVNENQCKMTYSHPKKSLVKVTDPPQKYKLWKVTNPDTKKLNKHPVIFIPGHLGSIDQSRSFASYMHNDDDLIQYFALDFNEEPIAFHAADILSKANFLNQAIYTILGLYEDNGNADPKFGLLGHSFGGFVAKTSMLLSNHPRQCFVKLLIMLSTPNLRPPFDFDVSFSKLYFDVNKGWYHSFYNDTLKCPRRFIAKERTELTACSKCLTNVTVLSFTGGEIDSHVRPEVTNIFEIAPRPKNISLIRESENSVGLLSISIISSVKKYIWNYCKSLFAPILSMFSSTANPSFNNNTITVNNSHPSLSSIKPSKPVIDSASPFASLSSESWNRDMAFYNDPHHIGVRTSQMEDVGFMIDHYAMLWCHQFVATVSSVMRSVLQRPYNINSNFELHKRLKLRNAEYIEEFLTEPKKLGIRQLTNYIRRNETNNDFKNIVAQEEQAMKQVLERNVFQFYATRLFLHHIEKLPVGCFNAAVLSIIGTLLALLFGEKYTSTPTSNMATIMNIFDTRPFVRIFQIASAFSEKKLGSSVNLWGAIGLVIAVAAWRFKWDWDTVDNVIATVLVFFLAVAIKLTLSIVTLTFRAVINLFGALLSSIGLLNILRKFSKNLKGGIFDKIGTWPAEFLFLAMYIISLVALGLPNQILVEPGTFVSSLLLFCFASSVLYFLANMMGFREIFTENNNQIADDLLFLHFITLLAAIPPVIFSFQNVYSPFTMELFRSGIFDMYGMDRLHAAMTLICIWLFSRHVSSFGSKLKIEPMNGFRLFIEPEPHKTNKICIHEDGGHKAMYERIPVCVDQKQISSEIVLGPTFKVVRCFCPTNRAFKSADEWCEWCKCKKCGYGELLQTKYNSNYSDKPRLHLEMAVVVGLCFAMFYLNCWGNNKVYMIFYVTGVIFLALWLRLFAKGSTFVLPDK